MSFDPSARLRAPAPPARRRSGSARARGRADRDGPAARRTSRWLGARNKARRAVQQHPRLWTSHQTAPRSSSPRTSDRACSSRPTPGQSRRPPSGFRFCPAGSGSRAERSFLVRRRANRRPAGAVGCVHSAANSLTFVPYLARATSVFPVEAAKTAANNLGFRSDVQAHFSRPRCWPFLQSQHAALRPAGQPPCRRWPPSPSTPPSMEPPASDPPVVPAPTPAPTDAPARPAPDPTDPPEKPDPAIVEFSEGEGLPRRRHPPRCHGLRAGPQRAPEARGRGSSASERIRPSPESATTSSRTTRRCSTTTSRAWRGKG